MQNVHTVIDALGGYANLARDLGKAAGSVSSWKSRGSIPAEYWFAIVQLPSAKAAGITTEVLACIHASSANTAAGKETAA